jgi:hypothetical protein
MNVYLSCSRENEMTPSGNPPVDLTFRAQKNDALVRYGTSGLSEPASEPELQALIPQE